MNESGKIMRLYKKNIFIFKVFLTVTLIMCPHMRDVVNCKELHKDMSAGPGDAAQEHVLVSQLEEGNATKKKTGSSSKRKEADSEVKTNTENNEKSSKPESKPLKRFEPSEKIKPDQAVDFPWDI